MMRRRSNADRPRFRPGAFFVICTTLLAVARPLGAQEPDTVPAPDTAAVADTLAIPDTLAAVGDTTTAVDTVPPPQLARFPDPVPTGWATGVWVWDREDLLEYTPLTLTDLLAQIPGITPVRSGFYGLPQAVSTLGMTGARTRIVLDGYVLDPLTAATFDLSRLELVELRRIRVLRRPGLLRIEIETLQPTEPEPYTLIGAGTGQYDTTLFRGVFLDPHVLFGPLGLALERLGTGGFLNRRSAPTNTFTGWVKWGLTEEDVGLQLEYRRSSVERAGAAPFPGSGMRQDLIVRARAQPIDRLVAGVFVGRSWLEDDFAEDPMLADSLDAAFEAASAQAGVRAFYDAERYWARTAIRARTGVRIAELAGGTSLSGVGLLRGRVGVADRRGTGPTLSFNFGGVFGPFHGFRAIAELASGERGVDFGRLADRAAVLTERTALRLGAAFSSGGLRLGAAAVRLTGDSVPVFGFAFEGAPRFFPAGETLGLEAHARVPLFWEPLRLEGWYTLWPEQPDRIYLPRQSWRAALVFHDLPLDSDNLEIVARLDHRRRGRMLVPTPENGAEIVPARTTLDFYLQIRIVDVRAFLRWDNITHRILQFDVPGRRLPGQRILYGVKWSFLN